MAEISVHIIFQIIRWVIGITPMYRQARLPSSPKALSPYRVWLNTQICVLRITPIYRLGNIGYDAYHPSQQTDLKNLFYFQYLTVLKIAVFSVNNPARIFFIQLGTLITPTYRFIEIMKVRKMERAENSDLDTSLAPGKYGNIFQEQEF